MIPFWRNLCDIRLYFFVICLTYIFVFLICLIYVFIFVICLIYVLIVFFICPIYVFNFVICPIYVLIVFVICLVGWSIYILFHLQPRGAVGKVGQNYLKPSGSLGSDFFRFLKLVIYRPKKNSSKYANKSIKRSVLKHWIQRSRFQVDLLII